MKNVGRGLESLIKIDSFKNEQNNVLLMLDIEKVKPNEDQPRKDFDQAKLEELAASIKSYGIIEPIVVKKKDNYFTIVAGERRWRAANILGLKEIPAVIKNDLEDLLEISIIENLQREDLNIVELAQGYQELINHYNYTHEALAEKLGVNRSSVSNTLRILKLPDSILEDVKKSKLSYGQARPLLALEDKKIQREIADEIIEKNLSARAVEKLIKDKTKKRIKQPKKESDDMYANSLAEWLSEHFDTKVTIKSRNNKGKIEICYDSVEQLQTLVNSLGYKENLI